MFFEIDEKSLQNKFIKIIEYFTNRQFLTPF